MLIGKLLAVVIFGAILTLPVHVTVGTMLAHWKPRERWVLVMAAVFSYVVVGWLIFGSD